jgi:iron complex outermembrane receptor protein
MKKKLFLISLPALLSISAHASAIAPEEADSMIYLDGVVVSANKVSVNRNSVPLSVTVIGREQIEASSESALLPVLSQRVPGLFVTRKGVTGFGVNTNSAGTVNIRGIGQGNKVLMLFDGQPQWAGVFGHSLPDTYVASDVDRVEVIRGPGSLLYGSNAMGGVVNIITRQAAGEGRHSGARVMYGSYNTQKYMVNNAFRKDKFSSFISLNYDRSDGMRENAAFDIVNGFANAGYELGRFKVKGDVSLASYENQNPGPVDNPMLDNTMDVVRGTASVSLTNTYPKSSGAIQVFYNWGRHEINDGYRAGGNPRTFLFNSSDHNMGVLVYETFRPFDGGSITAGADYKNWGGTAWNDSINGKRGDIVDRSVNEIAGYVIAQQDVLDKLSLNAGLRYEHSDAYGDQLVPQAGLTFRAFEGSVVKAVFSKGYRSPNVRELYISYPPYSMANPDLKPESMQSYELTVGQDMGGSFHAEVTAFYLEAKDMIAGVAGQLTNINSIHNKGIELQASYRVSAALSFTANYSLLKTDVATEAAPENKVFVEGSYSLARLKLTAGVESVGGLVRVGAAEGDAKEGYTLLDAKASYLFGSKEKGVNVFLKGENLTGVHYEILKGFPMPRATVMGGIDITF